jgi:prepilin-type N-terminal cleavage/methylation domain-containing protein
MAQRQGRPTATACKQTPNSAIFRAGFTLIELLVVIAIIAVMAAILFPVFSRAREKGRQARCLSQVKQIALAFDMYADDFDEHIPPDYSAKLEIRRAIDAKGMWYQQLQPYLRSLELLHCPSDNVNDARRTHSNCAPKLNTDPSLPPLSYGANTFLVNAWAVKEWAQYRSRPSIPRPSQTLLFADATEPWLWSFCPDRDRNGRHWSHIAYANGPPECRGDFHGGHSGTNHERHIAGSILCYVDGHAAYMPANRFTCRPSGKTMVERPLIWPESIPPEEAP